LKFRKRDKALKPRGTTDEHGWTLIELNRQDAEEDAKKETDEERNRRLRRLAQIGRGILGEEEPRWTTEVSRGDTEEKNHGAPDGHG
jgi:hypothetical protein